MEYARQGFMAASTHTHDRPPQKRPGATVARAQLLHVPGPSRPWKVYEPLLLAVQDDRLHLEQPLCNHGLNPRRPRQVSRPLEPPGGLRLLEIVVECTRRRVVGRDGERSIAHHGLLTFASARQGREGQTICIAWHWSKRRSFSLGFISYLHHLRQFDEKRRDGVFAGSYFNPPLHSEKSSATDDSANDYVT